MLLLLSRIARKESERNYSIYMYTVSKQMKRFKLHSSNHVKLYQEYGRCSEKPFYIESSTSEHFQNS